MRSTPRYWTIWRDKLKLHLDCDTGIDDALAILYLAKTSVELMSVSAVHGNVSVSQAASNCQYVLGLAGYTDVPVRIGAARPLVEEPHYAASVHGEDGLAGIGPDLQEDIPTDAIDHLIDLARAHRGNIALLATGPLTNLALAVMQAPDIADAFSKVVVMGGAIAAPGNKSITAEANILHDPEAAEIVLSRYTNVHLIGLDVTTTAYLTEAHIAQLQQRPNNPIAAFSASILTHYLGFYRSMGLPGCALHDPMAAMAVTEPGLFGFHDLLVQVELSGKLTRGMTVAERRPFHIANSKRPRVKAALAVQTTEVVDRMMAALLD